MLSKIISFLIMFGLMKTMYVNYHKNIPFSVPYLKINNREDAWKYTYIGNVSNLSLFLRDNVFIEDQKNTKLIIPKPNSTSENFIYKLWPDILGMYIFPVRLETSIYQAKITIDEYSKIARSITNTSFYYNNLTDKYRYRFHSTNLDVKNKIYKLFYAVNGEYLDIFILPEKWRSRA
jgi:hypothetical protein